MSAATAVYQPIGRCTCGSVFYVRVEALGYWEVECPDCERRTIVLAKEEHRVKEPAT